MRRLFGTAARCRKVQQRDTSKPPTAVDVSAISIDGDRASARVLIHGGDASGAKGGVRAQRAGGRWRVSDLGVDYLRSDLAHGLATVDPDLPELSRPPMRSCLIARFGAKPDAEFRRFAYAAIAEKPAAVQELFTTADACLKAGGDHGPGLLRRVFERGVTAQLRKSGARPALVTCVVRELRRAFTDRDLLKVTTARSPPSSRRRS